MRWWAGRPLIGIAVSSWGDEYDVGVFRDGVFLSLYDERLREPFWAGLRDADYGGDEAEFFVHDGTGHAAEEFGDILVVVPLAGGPALQDFIKI